MRSYLKILEKILDEGTIKETRTGINALSITGYMFEHCMFDGFPLLTTKKMGLRSVAAELEFFIKGLQDKRWLQERGCHIWDDWCNPELLPYNTDDRTKEMMKAENDLGRIYGVQWRDWSNWESHSHKSDLDSIDQLEQLVATLKKNPLDRRMLVSAWKPDELDKMALPPCHYAFQVLSDGKYIDLLWNQRSCDVPLGIPYNIASYALLLLLLAKESKLIPRKLIGFLADVHIYVNQIDTVKAQLKRSPYPLPTVNILGDKFIFDWEYTDVQLNGYVSHDKLEYPLAV